MNTKYKINLTVNSSMGVKIKLSWSRIGYQLIKLTYPFYVYTNLLELFP